SGYVPLWQERVRAMRFLILPAFTLGAYVSAVLARFTRAALLETLYQDYVRTARAKGLGEPPVVGVHALRNALLPVVTVVGLQFGAFMGGAVITEAIFDYPGLGRMLLQAILTRDYTVVQGTILFVVVAFVIINLLTDLAYALLDPRIRSSCPAQRGDSHAPRQPSQPPPLPRGPRRRQRRRGRHPDHRAKGRREEDGPNAHARPAAR